MMYMQDIVSPVSYPDDNVYVKELKQVFISCLNGNSDALDHDGLELLCRKLHLSEHAAYVCGQILPHEGQRVNFSQFKERFVVLLPEIIELSSTHDDFDIVNSSKSRDDDTYGATSDFSDDLINLSGDLLEIPSNHDRTKMPNMSKPGRITPLFIEESQTFEGLATGERSFTKSALSQATVKQQIESLGLATNGFLNGYEVKVLSRHLNLSELSQKELYAWYEGLESSLDGRVSVDKFLCSIPSLKLTKLGKRQSVSGGSVPDSSKGIADSAMSFFSAMKMGERGLATVDQVADYWKTLGIEDGKGVLELMGITASSRVDLVELSKALEHELTECTLGSEVLMAALLTYSAELCYLKDSLEQTHKMMSHYSQELQNVQSRNSMLVDELDQNQVQVEKRALANLRNVESKYQLEIRTSEERLKKEREQWIAQLTELEESIVQLKTTETALKSTISRLERENTQLCKEIQVLHNHLKQSVQQQSNKVGSFEAVITRRKIDSPEPDQGLAEQLKSWRARAEYHIAENKKLKDKVDELANACKNWQHVSKRTKHAAAKPPTPSLFNATRPKLKPLPRKIPKPGVDSSDFDSDLEPVIYRVRVKKLMNRRQRNKLIPQADNVPSSDGEQYTGSVDQRDGESSYLGRSLNLGRKLALLERGFSEEKKEIEHHYKMQMTSLEESWALEKRKIREQCEEDKAALLELFQKEKVELLLRKEAEMLEKAEAEKKNMEIRFASEKNVLEREFAEEKMLMMSRLQDDFEMELRRANRSPRPNSADAAMMETFALEKEKLEKDLEGMRRGYENRIKMLEDQHVHEKAELLADEEQRWMSIERARNVDELPEAVRPLIELLLEEHKNEQRKSQILEQQDIMESFQRERAQWMRNMELENDQLLKQHSAERKRLEEEKDAALLDLQQRYDAEKLELVQQLEELTRQKDATNVERNNVENRLRLETQRLEDRIIELERLHESKIASIQLEIDGFKRDNERLRGELELAQLLNEERAGLKEAVASTEEANATLQAQLDAQRQTDMQLKSRCEQLESQLEQSENEMQSNIHTLGLENEQSKQQVAVLCLRVSELETALTGKVELERTISALESDRAGLEIECQKLTADLSAALERREQLEARCSNLQSELIGYERALSELDTVNVQCKQYKALCDQYEVDLDVARQALDAALHVQVDTLDCEIQVSPDEARSDGIPLPRALIGQYEQNAAGAGESGVDEETSVDSNLEFDDPRELSRENKRILRQLAEANNKIVELRTCILLAESQTVRAHCTKQLQSLSTCDATFQSGASMEGGPCDQIEWPLGLVHNGQHKDLNLNASKQFNAQSQVNVKACELIKQLYLENRQLQSLKSGTMKSSDLEIVRGLLIKLIKHASHLPVGYDVGARAHSH